MSEIECPYCGDMMEWCGDPIGEDETVEHECENCEKKFIFTVSYSVDYWPEKADCLNDGEHDWEPIVGVPKEYYKGRFRCKTCHHEKKEEVE